MPLKASRALLTALLFLFQFWAPQGAAQELEVRTCHALEEREICIAEHSYKADVCAAIAVFAEHWSLPADYFARLIWQESRFNPAAVSPAGAQGIAQFMPSTARLRGLVNPFDAAEAMARSAEYLRFLELKFGNLGLAAAAYNGGEGRIGRYVANSGGALPAETRDYVTIVTGHSIDQWLINAVGEVDYTLDETSDFRTACVAMAETMRPPSLTTTSAQWQPWGVLLAQNASADRARSRFLATQTRFSSLLANEQPMLISVRNPRFGNQLRFSAMVGRPNRQEAEELCQRLLAMGGNCIVQKNAP